MSYGTLLFDADGTLLDFGRSEREAITQTLKQSVLPYDDEVIKLYSGINDGLWKQLERGEIKKDRIRTKRFEILCDKLGERRSAEQLADTYFVQLSRMPYLIPGALEVCRELCRTHRLYLITNGFKAVQQGRFCTSPIAGCFCDVFISEDIGFDKPSIKYFEAVETRIPDFDVRDSLVIGDSLTSDIAGGIGAGIDVCWYNPNNNKTPENMSINYMITDLYELIDITK